MNKPNRNNYKDESVLDCFYRRFVVKDNVADSDWERKFRIFEDWIEGDHLKVIGEKYNLSAESIRRIITICIRRYNISKEILDMINHGMIDPETFKFKLDEEPPTALRHVGLSVRTFNMLARTRMGWHGITDIRELSNVTEEEIMNIKGMGPATIEEIKKVMIEFNVNFKRGDINE